MDGVEQQLLPNLGQSVASLHCRVWVQARALKNINVILTVKLWELTRSQLECIGLNSVLSALSGSNKKAVVALYRNIII